MHASGCAPLLLYILLYGSDTYTSRQLGQIPASRARSTGIGLFVPKPVQMWAAKASLCPDYDFQPLIKVPADYTDRVTVTLKPSNSGGNGPDVTDDAIDAHATVESPSPTFSCPASRHVAMRSLWSCAGSNYFLSGYSSCTTATAMAPRNLSAALRGYIWAAQCCIAFIYACRSIRSPL